LKKVALIIPARLASSRFHGKPLMPINGRPMIQHVWEQSVKAISKDHTYIATDSLRISKFCKSIGANVLLTSRNCKTGTDRIAEANKKLGYDSVINVQGDEPLINPNDIRSLLKEHQKTGLITNGYQKICSKEEFYSASVPKVILNKNRELLYMSRAGIPTNKNQGFKKAFKQVCIYVYTKDHLKFFLQNPKKSFNEEIEDIEILRFLDHGFKVSMVEVKSQYIAVDFPADIPRVEKYLLANKSHG